MAVEALRPGVVPFPLALARPREQKRRTSPLRFISTQDVIALREYLVRVHQGRDSDYRILVNAYHGNYYVDDAENFDASGRLILRVSDTQREAVPFTANMLKGFADDYTSLLSPLPDLRVPVPYWRFRTVEEGERWAARVQRAAYGIWDASSISMQHIEAAWWLPVCGGFGSLVLPDFERGHAVIRYASPWTFYGVKDHLDPFSLAKCVVTTYEDADSLEQEFGDVVRQLETALPGEDLARAAAEGTDQGYKPKAIRHTIYLDKEWFMRLLNDREVGRVWHNLGFCPALARQFILLPDYLRGHSAIEQAVPMQLSANYALSLWEEALKDEVFKTIYVVDPQNVPENFQRGKGLVITVNPGGAVGEFGGASGALQTVAGHIELLARLIEINTGVSRVRTEGRLSSGGPTTGRGVEKVQGSQLGRVETIQQIQAYYTAKEMLYAFRMTADEKIWEGERDEAVTFEGLMRGGGSYLEQMTRAELREVPVVEPVFSPIAHLGLGERVNIALQLYNANPPLLSWQDMVEVHSLVRDIPALRARIETDLRWRAQIAALAAGGQLTPEMAERLGASLDAGATNVDTLRRAGATAVEGAAAPVTPVAAVPSGGAPAAAGAPGVAEAPLAADAGASQAAFERLIREGPEPAAEPIPTGLEERPLEDEVRAELSTLDLKGRVWLRGNVVLAGAWQDVAQIRARLKHHADVRVRAAKGAPRDAIEVAAAREAAP